MSVLSSLHWLTQQHRARPFLHGKIVIQPLLHMDALARRQADLRSGRDVIGTPIRVDGDVAFIVDLLVGQGVIDSDEHIAAAAVDDVLRLVPVKVVWRVLTLLQIQQLFRVDLGVFVWQGAIAVADGDERKAEFVKIALAVVRDVPAEHTLAHLVVLMPERLPLFRRKAAEGRQIAAVLPAHRLQLLQRSVDLRTFHIASSNILFRRL